MKQTMLFVYHGRQLKAWFVWVMHVHRLRHSLYGGISHHPLLIYNLTIQQHVCGNSCSLARLLYNVHRRNTSLNAPSSST